MTLSGLLKYKNNLTFLEQGKACLVCFPKILLIYNDLSHDIYKKINKLTCYNIN